MWNLMTTSRPSAARAGWADPVQVFGETKDHLVAPKPPKKRFLEAAAAAQQEEEEKAVSGSPPRPAEDNSALMHLAEMCVIYQKRDQPAIR